MSLHLLRIVLKSGSLTELMFDKESDMLSASLAAERGGRVLRDDYGHVIRIEPEQLAATILVDVDAELKGQSIVTFARQMMQDRLSERVQKTRELAAPLMPGRPPNGGAVLLRG